MGYTRNVFQGVGWNGTLKIATTLLTMGKIYILSRLLTPADFGLFSLVAIALGLMESVTETGVNTTIVQSNKSIRYFLDTAWVIAIFRGLIISILMLIVGLGMARFYNQELLIPLIAFAAFIPFIKGFINPAIITLHKELSFFKDSVYRFSLVLVEVFASVLLGYFFRSAAVLVGGLFCSAVFEVIVSFLFFRDRPRFVYIKSRASEIFHNARSLNVTALLTYAIQNLDNLVVGKFVTISELGLYANGYNLSHKLNTELAKSVQHATFPVYVKIVGTPERIRRAFWKSFLSGMFLFSLLSVPFMLFPRWIFLLLPESKWAGVEQILPLLLLAGLIQSMIILGSGLFIACKKYAWLNGTLIVNAALLIPLVVGFSMNYGLIGGVYGVLLSRFLALPITCFGIWQTLYTKPSR